MTAVLPQQRLALVIGVSVVGIAASWLTATPFGLLVPVAALNLYARGRTVQLLYAILGIALAGLVLAAWFDVGGMRDLALLWAAFFAVALCVAAVVTTSLSASLNDDAVWAAQVIERVVGNAWATDAAGRFTYVTPAMLSLLGMTLEEFNSPSEEGPSGWRRIIHPDDYDGAVATWRRCLQTGEHYNVEHRMLRASGAYGWSRSSGQPLRDSQGHVLAWYGTIVDGDVPLVVSERFADVVSAALEERAAPDAPHSLSLIHPNDRTATAHAAARAFWTGVPQVTRHRQLQADGNYRWTETRSEPGYSVSVDIDDLVTDREPLTTTGLDPLGENEADPIRSAKVIESIFGNGWAFDATGRWIYLHPFAQNSLGVTPEDLNASLKEGHTAWKRLLHPDDYDQIAAAWRHCLETGDHFNVEFRFRRATGIYVWARTAARPTRDSQGHITGWFGIALDIDVYKKTVAALRDRERELSQLVNMVPVQIKRLTPEGEPTFFNKRALDFFGLNDLTQVDKPDMSRLAAAIQSLVHPDDTASLLETARHSFATGEPFSVKYRVRRADGAYRWVDGRGEPLRDQGGAIVQWFVISIDIDDEMRAQEALRDRERRLQQLVDAVPVNIITFTPDGKPSFANKRYQDFLGFTLPHFETLGEQLHAIIHPDDVSEMQRALLNCFKTGSTFLMRYRRRGKGGAYYWTEGRMEPLLDQNGAIEHWYAVSLDIDDEMRAQEALRERERFLWQLVETLPVMIDCAAPDGEPVYRSRQLREFLGYELEELDGTGKGRMAGTLDAGVHPDDVAGVKERYAHSLATGAPYARKFRLRRFDGEYRWIETRVAPMRNAEGAIVQWNIICLDIDSEVRAQEELRLAQERLARASQAASLAELSASVAHEVNQPLAAIVANSHACYRWLAAEPPNIVRAKATAERIIRDANSAADVVGRIRALFKQSIDTRISTTLGSVMAEAHNLMAEEAARRRVRLDFDIESELPLVALDRVQIQ
ncbi:PAS domain-containing protein, partial [Mesorhizobium sp. BHbsci]